MAVQTRPVHSIESSTLADILERVLDKGIVIAGDIKIKIADVELLTIQIRLVVCSVDKAVEMGLNWWTTDPNLSPQAQPAQNAREVEELRGRLAQLEETVLRP
jgi:hypothetical protein